MKLRLRRAPEAPATLRWHTFGMPAALADDDSRRDQWRAPWRAPGRRVLFARERMSRRAGFICYTAPPDILRAHAIGIYRTHVHRASYYPLAEHGVRNRWGFDGEFQLIPGFADVSAARVARREILDRDEGPLATDDERWTIYCRKNRALERLRAARRRAPRGDS